MSTQSRLADVLLREAGYGGLWEWAMDQRRSVRPMPWDDVAVRLGIVTRGQVQVKGVMLRKWVTAAEQNRAVPIEQQEIRQIPESAVQSSMVRIEADAKDRQG